MNRTCRSSIFPSRQPTSPDQKFHQQETLSQLKMCQIDFNKVLNLINLQTYQQFISSRNKKLFHQTQRSKQKKSQKVAKKCRIHTRNKSTQQTKFQNQFLMTQFNKFQLNQLNKKFIENQNVFRASFPVRRDINKVRNQAKCKVNKQKWKFVKRQNNKNSKFIKLNQSQMLRNSVIEQAMACKNIYTMQATAASTPFYGIPNDKSNSQQKNREITVHKIQLKNGEIKYYKKDEIESRHNNNFKQIIFRQISNQTKKQKQVVQPSSIKNTLENRKQSSKYIEKQNKNSARFQSVQKYLQLMIKNISLVDRTNLVNSKNAKKAHNKS